jgi:thioredoxin 1
MVAPEFEKLSKEYPGAIFVKVDVDAQEGISQMCGIRAMPTFQFFKNGEKVDELMGANVQALKTKVQSLA